MHGKGRDVLVRAGRTFWQAMLAYLLADATVLHTALYNIANLRRALWSLLIGAVAAGLSAVYNSVIVPLFRRDENGK